MINRDARSNRDQGTIGPSERSCYPMSMDGSSSVIQAYGMTWHFSSRALNALDRMGVSSISGLNSFILKLLTMRVVRQGETEINFFGTGLRVQQEGTRYTVATLEESLSSVTAQ